MRLTNTIINNTNKSNVDNFVNTTLLDAIETSRRNIVDEVGYGNIKRQTANILLKALKAKQLEQILEFSKIADVSYYETFHIEDMWRV